MNQSPVAAVGLGLQLVLTLPTSIVLLNAHHSGTTLTVLVSLPQGGT